MKSADYWAKRAEAREKAAQRDSGKLAEAVRRAYNRAFDDIEYEIHKIRRAHPDLANEPEQWRVARLNEVKADIDGIVRRLGKYENDASTARYGAAVRTGYYRVLYDTQQGLGMGFSVAQVPENAVNAALADSWTGGKNYSARIWGNAETIAAKAGDVVTAGLMSGETVPDMAADLARVNRAGKFAAERLIRTETNYFCNQGELLAYAEAGIDEYQFLATLDNRTSQACQDHDGIHYPVAEAKAGDNYPPLHPFCRSTTVAWFGDEAVKGMERRARDPETGRLYTVPAEMSYGEWKETFARPDGSNTLDISAKMVHNEGEDRKQYGKYKLVFGKQAVGKFSEFQHMKYSDADTWEKMKLDKQEVLNGLPYRPAFDAQFSNAEVRKWYVTQTKTIAAQIDANAPLEEQARQAFELRNRYKRQARKMMADTREAERLTKQEAIKSFDQLIAEKMSKYNLTKREALEDMLRSSGVTRQSVNDEYWAR